MGAELYTMNIGSATLFPGLDGLNRPWYRKYPPV
jgi:hypothetical protein